MNAFAEALPVIWVALGVVLLLILNMRFKINGMLALLLAAIFVGVCEGLPLEASASPQRCLIVLGRRKCSGPLWLLG